MTMLEYLRRAAEMTQEDLARLAGIARSTISLTEGQRYLPSRRQLEKVCVVLGVGAEDAPKLLTMYDNPEEPR